VLSIGGWPVAPVAAQDAAAEETEAADEDRFTIPEGDAGEIAEFIQKLAQTEPEGETQDEQLAFAERVLRTILGASERMLQAKPDEDQEVNAHEYRLMALQGLSQLGGPEDAEAYAGAVDALMEAERPEIARVGWRMFLNDRLSAWPTLEADAKEEVRKKLVLRLKAGQATPLDVNLVAYVAQNLDRLDDEFVTRLLTMTVPVFQKSEAPEIEEALAEANLEGMLRRMTLLGKPMEVFGELLSGGDVDWKSYRGKVVLVDFWATWCGPCRAEVPNILKQYRAYHDKGFEVLGVSLDRTPEDAHGYIEDMKLPWDSLFPANEDDRFWNHPLARHYGITGIPTAILVDQKGQVVHMEARGPVLREQLQELLGDPIEPAEAPATEAAAVDPADATGG
jgi:thiol-disulfide isomerase/thioredoxin